MKSSSLLLLGAGIVALLLFQKSEMPSLGAPTMTNQPNSTAKATGVAGAVAGVAAAFKGIFSGPTTSPLTSGTPPSNPNDTAGITTPGVTDDYSSYLL